MLRQFAEYELLEHAGEAEPEEPRCGGKGWIRLSVPPPAYASKRCPGCIDCQPTPERGLEISDEELEALHAQADQLEAEGKLVTVPPVEPPENMLRIIWREVDGRQCRCSTFIPIPEEIGHGEAFRAALGTARPRFTAYIYDEAKRMVKAELERSTQPVSESPGDSGVEIDGAVELLAERLFRFHAINTGAVTRWPDSAEGTRNGWRQDARSHLEAIRHLLTQPVPGNSGGWDWAWHTLEEHGEEAMPAGTKDQIAKLTEVCPGCEGEGGGSGIDEPTWTCDRCEGLGRVPKRSSD